MTTSRKAHAMDLQMVSDTFGDGASRVEAPPDPNLYRDWDASGGWGYLDEETN